MTTVHTVAHTGLAQQADYADALLTARRAKTACFLLLLLILLTQVVLFFLYRYDVILPRDLVPPAASAEVTASAVPPAAEVTVPAGPSIGRGERAWAHYLVSATVYLGLLLSVALVTLLVLQLLVVLVSRAYGVGPVTSAFVWMLLLTLLLIPWFPLLNFPGLAGADFRVPGVLYTWRELLTGGRFAEDWTPAGAAETVLKWARFVGFPVVAIVQLMVVQTRSNRGLKMALGETHVARGDDVIV